MISRRKILTSGPTAGFGLGVGVMPFTVAEAADKPDKITDDTATAVFPERVTAMCEVQVGKLAVAAGNKVWIVRIK